MQSDEEEVAMCVDETLFDILHSRTPVFEAGALLLADRVPANDQRSPYERLDDRLQQLAHRLDLMETLTQQALAFQQMQHPSKRVRFQ